MIPLNYFCSYYLILNRKSGLVNNAGINGPEKDSTEISTKDWDEVLDINLKGCFMCSREAIKKC
jgi:NAD(P)-dependent dehydrogenase (short-subunit alcohol dehydrogenase family)